MTWENPLALLAGITIPAIIAPLGAQAEAPATAGAQPHAVARLPCRAAVRATLAAAAQPPPALAADADRRAAGPCGRPALPPRRRRRGATWWFCWMPRAACARRTWPPIASRPPEVLSRPGAVPGPRPADDADPAGRAAPGAGGGGALGRSGRAALASESASYGPPDVAAGVALASGLTQGPPSGCWSRDGGIALPEGAYRPAGTGYRSILVGTDAGNIAVTGLALRQGESDLRLQAGLRNAGTAAVEGRSNCSPREG